MSSVDHLWQKDTSSKSHKNQARTIPVCILNSTCGKCRFRSIKQAQSITTKKQRMRDLKKCRGETPVLDLLLTRYFQGLDSNGVLRNATACRSLKIECNLIEPRSKNSYGMKKIRDCFENWYSTDTESFIDKCRKHLSKAEYFATVDSVTDRMIASHLKCLQQFLRYEIVKISTIKQAMKILEDRIHYANYCYSFF